MHIRSEIKELSSVERELAIVVPGDEVAKELDRAYRALAQKVRLKGFRQGKVPRYVLEQYYKADTEAQVLEYILGESYRQAVKSHELLPVASPTIQNAAELIPGMDFSFTCRVEVKPHIDIKGWQELSVTKKVYEITEQDVDRELNALRDRFAKVTPVEDRDVVQQGDLVEINWSGTVDGEHVKGLSGVSSVVEVGGGAYFREAEQALVGKKLGDAFNVDVTVPTEHRIEVARGKVATLQIKPIGLKKKLLPELDDEFAKDVSDESETLTALRENIKSSLAERYQSRAKNELREETITALIEKNPFDVPASLIDRQAEQLAADRLSRLPKAQAEAIWQRQGERLKEDARPLAARQVRAGLILEELVKQQGIEVSDDDVEQRIETLAKDLGVQPKVVRNVYKKDNRILELRAQIASERMLERIIESARIEEKKVDIGA